MKTITILEEDTIVINHPEEADIVKPRELLFRDYPAAFIQLFARELDAYRSSRDKERRFQVILETQEFLCDKEPWLPFSIALNALILAPECVVIFKDPRNTPVKYSALLDVRRALYSRSPLYAIRNFAMYLNVKKDDRANRLFYIRKDGDKPESIEMEISPFREMGFSPYYLGWLDNGLAYKYGGHPFDHVPLRNVNYGNEDFRTETQWKKLKRKGIPGKEVYLHDQILTVRLTKYYHWDDTVEL